MPLRVMFWTISHRPSVRLVPIRALGRRCSHPLREPDGQCLPRQSQHAAKVPSINGPFTYPCMNGGMTRMGIVRTMQMTCRSSSPPRSLEGVSCEHRRRDRLGLTWILAKTRRPLVQRSDNSMHTCTLRTFSSRRSQGFYINGARKDR